ncbi:MAG: tail fiber domain-containing protein [Chitinophagales bacterium]|nr:tail fiber domain-containing protein [Chitinophagales bacterium]
MKIFIPTKYLPFYLLLILAIGILLPVSAQVGINSSGASPDNSAGLDVNYNNKGLLLPRVALTSTTDAATIATPATSLLVYNTSNLGGLSPGFYYNSGTPAAPLWLRLLTPDAANAWLLTGNAGTVDGTNFIGTTDSVPLNFRVNNQKAGRVENSNFGSTFLGYQAGNSQTATDKINVGVGYQTLYFNTTGSSNTANGSLALYSNTTGSSNTANGIEALYSNTTGYYNTAIGNRALYSNTNGWNNTAIGNRALYRNTTGDYNTATGYQALYFNTTGYYNTANGYQALWYNTTGSSNTANGRYALFYNTIGSSNTANGMYALYHNTIGNWNVANGMLALYYNIDGYYNTANGDQSLYNNTSGGFNTANGHQALYYNTTGTNNTANGHQALYNNTIGGFNTANRHQALYLNAIGDFNTAIGYRANVSVGTLTNATAIGNAALVNASNKVIIGNTSVGSIGGQVAWTAFSDERIKDDIQYDNVPGLAFIKLLRPATYHFSISKSNQLLGIIDTTDWEGKYDIEKIQFSGFIAQQVEAAAAQIHYDFSGVDKSGSIMGLRYAEFTVPLVKAVQEQQDIIEQQNTKINQQEAQISSMQERLDRLEQMLMNK